MVEVVDVTRERELAKNRGLLEKELATKCFPKKEIILNDTILYIRARGGMLAEKMIGTIKMTVYDESILPQTEKFAEKYEYTFNVSDFIIQTDYSQ